MQDRVPRLASAGALFATAIVTGAIAASTSAAFIVRIRVARSGES